MNNAKNMLFYSNFALPSDEAQNISEKMRCDSFYKLPREIECFIDRANNELPCGYSVAPWTINRAVTVFHNKLPVKYIAYESIEDNIIMMLDNLNKMAKE